MTGAGRQISGGDPAFRADDGSADPVVTTALAAYADGSGSESAAMSALAGSRLLVPIVAESGEMALPTLIGRDGRPAVPAFTCLDALRRWRPAARPVPTPARQVLQAAVGERCAVVVDVAGPVPFVLDGARLAALARGAPAPQLCDDPDVHAAVTDALAAYPGVARFELGPGDEERDLALVVTLTPGMADPDPELLAASVGAAVVAGLGGRLRRGVAISFTSLPA